MYIYALSVEAKNNFVVMNDAQTQDNAKEKILSLILEIINDLIWKVILLYDEIDNISLMKN